MIEALILINNKKNIITIMYSCNEEERGKKK